MDDIKLIITKLLKMDEKQKDFLEWLIEDIDISWKLMYKKHTKEFEPNSKYSSEISHFQGITHRGQKIIKVGEEEYTTIFFYPLIIKRYLQKNA